jgi:hypothetical protein
MSVPLTGDVTSRQLAGVCKGSPSSSFSLISPEARHVAGRSSGEIKYSDFRGKIWRQGNVSGSIPAGRDDRLDGYTSSPSGGSGSGSTWVADLYQNDFGYGEYKGASACNSYFYCSTPGLHKLTGKLQCSSQGTPTGEKYMRANLYVWGYSSGYLSGSRVLYDAKEISGSSVFDLSMTFNARSGNPYVVINLEAWGDGINSYSNARHVVATLTGAVVNFQ